MTRTDIDRTLRHLGHVRRLYHGTTDDRERRRLGSIYDEMWGQVVPYISGEALCTKEKAA